MKKGFFQSKTVWGILIALIMVVLNIFNMNVTLPNADPQAVQLFQSLIAIGGMILAVWGRVKAEISGTGAKAWYQSKTILGILLALAMTVLHYFGLNIPITSILGVDADPQTLGLGNDITGVIGLILALIGRVKAEKTLTLTR